MVQKTKHKNALFFYISSSIVSSIFFVSSCSLISDYSSNILVSNVIDGDTFESDNKKYRILGIDTPEVYDSKNNFLPTTGLQYFYGKLASNVASELLLNKWIEIESLKTDNYNRLITKVTINNKIDFSSYMVKNGYAKVRYISNNKNSLFYYYDNEYINNLNMLEEEAKLNKRGFWRETKDNINKIYPS
ncbi:MAG: nuclease [Mycoplasma sp.]|nr:nuclease [Mycoplasma sp.]